MTATPDSRPRDEASAEADEDAAAVLVVVAALAAAQRTEAEPVAVRSVWGQRPGPWAGADQWWASGLPR